MKLRRLLPTLITVAALSLGLSACSDGSSGHKYTIGVTVIVAHPALEAAQKGFEDVLTEEGLDYGIIFENAQGEKSNAATIATMFADNKKIDLMLAISTDSSLALANVEKSRPILFTAVTDPVQEGLVPSWQTAAPNMTGTSDLNPGANTIALMKEAMPNLKNVGVLYTSSESNSLSQVDVYRTEAAVLGVTLQLQGITNASEVSVGLAALKDVEAIIVPTDNTVVAAIESVIAFGKENKIPIFCADSSTVELGTVATRGLSYYELGRVTGEMAVGILRDGKTVADYPPQAPTGTDLSVNVTSAEAYGLTLPEEFVALAQTKF